MIIIWKHVFICVLKLLTVNSKSNSTNKVDENADKSLVAGDDVESWKEVCFN